MPKQTISFDIDDALNVDENIAAFIGKLNDLDAPLASVLDGPLARLSDEIAIDQAHLLDALFAATAPRTEAADGNDDGDREAAR